MLPRRLLTLGCNRAGASKDENNAGVSVNHDAPHLRKY
jgi:hypothetical protein